MSIARLLDVAQERIVVLDGAMGTMVQGLGLADEAVWRGDRFRDHSHPLKGCNDLLVLTKPEEIEEILLNALAGDPARRYRSALEFLEDINDFAYETGTRLLDAHFADYIGRFLKADEPGRAQ